MILPRRQGQLPAHDSHRPFIAQGAARTGRRPVVTHSQRSQGRGRGHEDACAVVAAREPGVVEAGDLVYHRQAVGVVRSPAAPLVAEVNVAELRPRFLELPADAVNDLGVQLGAASSVSTVPPTSRRPSSICVANGATEPGRLTGTGAVAARWPFTKSDGKSRSRPGNCGGPPVAKMTDQGDRGPNGGRDSDHGASLFLAAGGRDAGGDVRQLSRYAANGT